MPPQKRARTAAAASSSALSSSSQPAGTAAPKLTLSGGVPHHPSLVALWRDERLTDFAVCTEGVEFKAHLQEQQAKKFELGQKHPLEILSPASSSSLSKSGKHSEDK